jgi:hypothetical protein
VARLLLAPVLALALTLAACGGDDEPPPPPAGEIQQLTERLQRLRLRVANASESARDDANRRLEEVERDAQRLEDDIRDRLPEDEPVRRELERATDGIVRDAEDARDRLPDVLDRLGG